MTREIIAHILGVEESAAWQILATDQNLALVHYDDEADMTTMGHLRGVVVDVEAKLTIAKSYGFTDTQVIDGTLPENQIYKIGYEGTVMRVFFHHGKVYHSTHRRLDSSRSRWGSSIPFAEMYETLGAPKDEELFDLTKKYSPHCHMFLMVHPDVIIATREDIGKGYLVYLGSHEMWTVDQAPWPMEELDMDLRTPSPENVVYPKPLEVGDAMYHLTFGYGDMKRPLPKDPRLGPGEFVIQYGSDGKLTKLVSPAYQWRADLHGNNPNRAYQMYKLMTQSLNPSAYSFPIVSHYSVESLRREITIAPIDQFIEDRPAQLLIPDDYLYNTFMCFLRAVPPSQQKMAIELYDRIHQDRASVAVWLQTKIGNVLLSPRAQKLIELAVNSAKGPLPAGMRPRPFDQRVAINLRNLLKKEVGESLYKLAREMRQEPVA